ncbi:MAG: hypothetical protein Kow0010_22890 [Dehalococcoidia bacterium]
MKRIDAHTHLFAPGQRAERAQIAATDATFAEMYGDPAAKMATAEQLIAAIDAAGIDGAVAAGFAFASEREIGRQNEYLLATACASAGRIAAVATVNPALPGWERLAGQALAGGARGFGELRPASQGWDPLGPNGERLCRLAADAGAVLLWHVSEPAGHRYPGKTGGIGPAELIAVATAHPDVAMVGAHLGAGAAFFLHMPEVRRSIELLYFDTAAFTLLYDESSVAQLVATAGHGRVLFGSDFPLLSPTRQLARVTALLERDALEAVCGGNAQHLYFGSTPKR